MKAEHDARRYRRVAMKMPAEIVINVVDKYDGHLLNISPGNLAVICDAQTVPGDTARVGVKNFDVFDGTVARVFPDGFAVSFLLSKKRQAKLIEKIMLHTNRPFAEGLDDQRSALRHEGSNLRTSCRLADGSSLHVRVIDRSVDGISVEAPRRPPLGSEIHIGAQRGIIARHTPRGFVVIYDGVAAGAKSVTLRAV